MKRIVCAAALVAALVLAAGGARAERICLDGGTIGTLDLNLPAVCVPVP